MKIRKIFMVLVIAFVLLLSGCVKQITRDDLQWEHVNRIDIFTIQPDGTYGDERIIVESSDIDDLRDIFSSLSWKENVKISMSREPDAKIIFFFRYDRNMPERLVEYLIWFNEGGTIQIIDHERHATTKIDEEKADKLRAYLLSE